MPNNQCTIIAVTLIIVVVTVCKGSYEEGDIVKRYIASCCEQQLQFSEHHGTCTSTSNDNEPGSPRGFPRTWTIPTVPQFMDKVNKTKLTFQFVQRMLDCSSSVSNVSIFPKRKLSIGFLPSNKDLQDHGHQIWSLYYNNDSYPSGKYCVNELSKVRSTFIICKEKPEVRNETVSSEAKTTTTTTTTTSTSTIPTRTPGHVKESTCDTTGVCVASAKLPKCCQLSQRVALKGKKPSCLRPGTNVTSWTPKFYNDTDLSSETEPDPEPEVVFNGFPRCKYRILDNTLDTWFRMKADTLASVEVGLNFWTFEIWLKAKPGSFCVDELIQNPDSENSSNYVLAFCELEQFEQYLFHRRLFLGLFILSSIFLILTLFIYGLTWKSQNIHGWTQCSFFLVLCISSILEASRIALKLNGLNIVPNHGCFVLAVVTHYFVLCNSTTSVVVGFDCCYTFWFLKAKQTTKKKQFIAYSVVNWGIPLLAIVVGLIIHHVADEDAEKHERGVFEYAHYRCSSPIWETVYTVQMFLLIVNTIEFALTIYFICKHRRSVKAARSGGTRRFIRDSVILFIKLFVINVMFWLIFVIESVFGKDAPLAWSFMIPRAISVLQGLWFFIMFGWNYKNVKGLKAKYPAFLQMYEFCYPPKNNVISSHSASRSSVAQTYRSRRAPSQLSSKVSFHAPAPTVPLPAAAALNT